LSQAVIKVKPKELPIIERFILATQHASSLKVASEYEAFRIGFEGDSIIGYTSGKIVCSGLHAEAIVQTAVRNLTEGIKKNKLVIGSDEAGKGEWLGPLVIAAVAATEDQSRSLQSLGVMDSKDVPINRLSKIAGQIELECTDKKVLLIPPETFNVRLKELHEEGKNLNDLLAWGHAKVISELYNRISSKDAIRVVIDEFARLKTQQRLSRVIPLENIELVQRPRAEDEIAVAAASILAREAREQWIDQYSLQHKLDLRELNIPEALAHADKISFSKIQYLEKMNRRK
jgi:ribonuclease HIII